MLIVLVMACLFSLALYFAVFRPLRAASSLAKVVASVGIMIAIQAVVIINFGTGARRPSSLLPAESVHLFGLDFPRDRFTNVMQIDAKSWGRELASHDALFAKLGGKRPSALVTERQKLAERLAV
jgi:hypothetical protein